ncbi:MAG: restriction endonuclease subunit R, partial [Myxococcota bacterium]
RARASEMEHALRYHIRQNIDKDPVYYKTLSERLEEILKELKDQWDKLTRQLEEFIKEVVAGRQEDETGLAPKTQAPFYDMLCHTLVGKDKPTEEQQQKLIDLTIELVEHIKQEIRRVNFWNNVNAQEVLRSDIFERMDDVDLFPFDKLEATADKLVELAKRNRHYLEN